MPKPTDRTRTLTTGIMVREYDSPSEVVEGALELSDASKYSAAYSMLKYTGGGDSADARWLGFDSVPSGTYRDALKNEIQTGWPKGADILNRTSDGLMSAIRSAKSLRPKVGGGYSSGFDPFVPGLLQGRPDNWRQWEPRKRLNGSKGVTLVAECSASYYYVAGDLVWSGAVALILADMLTNAGYTVEIKTCNTVSLDGGENDRVSTLVTLKRAEDPLQINQLASTLVSPRFFRVGMIPVSWTFEGRQIRGNAGYPTKLSPTELSELVPESSVYIPRVFSLEAARELLKAEISKINGDTP